ncbi:MAG: UDP-N-acetylmuramate--L-alanine ligase [Spirochaetaceae bacterium]|jgi:UDP-N-acetylmuramate--alanine ligase|nr:UDP-N-acetylmuramate--L-alanine ligase [Spirochaetaceae bacterium]
MNMADLLRRTGASIYCVGIKGSGVCALAELLHRRGCKVSGSDRKEVFYTDRLLRALGIPYFESFEPRHLPPDTELIVYSAAYSPESNPELVEAQNRGIPALKYPDALGAYSALFDSSGIAGVHGKTTTTAMAGTLMRGAGLPVQILAGSAVGAFGGGCTLTLGSTYFVAETCEYRRHFLAFQPRRIVLTSVEPDHQDYYPTYQAIRDAFLEYAGKLPPGGELIYCADDPGARDVATRLKQEPQGKDVQFIPYGFTASGPFQIQSYQVAHESARIGLAGFPEPLTLRIPGRHSALNAVGALALTDALVRCEPPHGWRPEPWEGARRGLAAFTGSKRRAEILGEKDGVLFMDDYGHHPTAVQVTLAGLKEFYPQRRLVVSFMPHTYSRTASLLEAFSQSFVQADITLLHRIYPSAREATETHLWAGVRGEALFDRVRARQEAVYYVAEPLDALDLLRGILRPGDLFITMGAGDNWKLAEALLNHAAGGLRPAGGKE